MQQRYLLVHRAGIDQIPLHILSPLHWPSLAPVFLIGKSSGAAVQCVPCVRYAFPLFNESNSAIERANFNQLSQLRYFVEWVKLALLH